MAAIDKIYLHSYDEYIQFRNWLLKQPKLKDKYENEVSLMRYFFDYWDKESWLDEDGNNVSHPVYSAPCYVDAYIIRNCPLDFVQIAIRGNYGYREQYEIDDWYDTVKHRTEEEQKIIDEYNANHKDGDYNVPRDAKGNTIPCWWITLDDFEILDDGKIFYKKLEKSSYEEILDGELFTTPYREGVKRGTHFKLVKCPYKHSRKGIPFERSIDGPWWVDVEIGNYDSLWFNSNDPTDINGTWDFLDEFVEKKYSSSCCVHMKTITAIKRHIRKWNLPIGARVIVRGNYEGEDYEFLVTR